MTRIHQQYRHLNWSDRVRYQMSVQLHTSAEIFERLGTLQRIIEIAGIIGSDKSDNIENMFLQWLSSTMNLAPADSPALPTVKSFAALDKVISKRLQAAQQRFTITDALASL
jgi:hypothetical protein